MDKEQIAIQRLQAASEMSLQYYEQPLVITDSGGKDSSVCKELAIRAGIPFEIIHSHTTADAPETVRFVRAEFKRFEEKGVKCTVIRPTYKNERTSMWELIPQKLYPPTRLVRYCCSILKETGGANRFIATGVRWAESASRKNNRGIYENIARNKEARTILNNDNDDRRLLFESCRLKSKRVVNPIVDWTDDEVWSFLNDAATPVNPLYGEGWCRVGCVGCPMARKKGREKEFLRWPKYKDLYIKAFDNMLEERKRRGKDDEASKTGSTGNDVFNWWMEYDILPGQLNFESLYAEEED